MPSNAAAMAAELNKVLGAGTVLVGSDPALEVQYLPTGVLPIDILLRGGLPRGRVTEVYGSFSSLKSFVALCAAATTQADGGTAALVDTELSYDPVWFGQLGGNPDELIVMHPEHGEKAVMVTETLMRSGIDLIVWDSVAAMITKNSIEKTSEDDVQPARLAAFMSKALPRLNAANTGKTAVLMVNQTRVNVGITFGSNEATPGGKALPYYASFRMKFNKAGKITEDTKVWDGDKYVNTKQQMGTKIRVTLEKSKLNKPFREAWFTFDFEQGAVDELGFLIAQGLEAGLIEQTNARWTLLREGKEDKKFHGQAKFREALDEEDQQWLIDQLLLED